MIRILPVLILQEEEDMETESESKPVFLKQKPKLEVLDILKESLRIYFNNSNFIIFTFLTSLPLFCFMLYFETKLQEILAETVEILSRYFDEDNILSPGILIRRFNLDYFLDLVQLGVIYLLPLHVLEICTVIATVDLASKMVSEDKKLTLKETLQKPIKMSNLKGTLRTSTYVLFLSSCYSLVFSLIVINYFVFLKIRYFNVVSAVFSSMVVAKFLKMYLELSAMWNMSLVISLLEGIHGFQALVNANYFSEGYQRRGPSLMFVFFAWGQLLRLLCLHMGSYRGGNGIIVQVGLYCVVNVLKWVVCFVYFCECLGRKLEKKVDKEMSKDVEAVLETTGCNAQKHGSC